MLKWLIRLRTVISKHYLEGTPTSRARSYPHSRSTSFESFIFVDIKIPLIISALPSTRLHLRAPCHPPAVLHPSTLRAPSSDVTGLQRSFVHPIPPLALGGPADRQEGKGVHRLTVQMEHKPIYIPQAPASYTGSTHSVDPGYRTTLFVFTGGPLGRQRK